jgi:hypothetical protein
MNFRILISRLLSAFSLLVFVFVLSSCSKDDSVPENNTGRQRITFKANPIVTETNSISTRVSVTPGDINGNDALSWTNNESISVNFGNSTAFSETFNVTLEEGGYASLTGDGPDENGAYNIYAISPANTSCFQGGVLGDAILSIAQTQEQDGENYNHLSKYVYMHASSETPITIDNNGYNGDVTLDFDLLTSLLRFDIINNSSTDVTLEHIKISFLQNGGTLYNEIKLDEESGAISTNGVATHSDMSLTFSDADLTGGNSFIGYMCLFPTGGSGDLIVDLSVTYDENKTTTIKYAILNAPALLAGNRYVVPLDIQDMDFHLYEIIGDKSYLCYDYDGTIWMVENLALETYGCIKEYNENPEMVNGYYYTWSRAQSICSGDWELPSLAQWDALKNIVNADPTDAGKWWTQTAYGAFAGVYNAQGGGLWSGWGDVDSWASWWVSGTEGAYYYSNGTLGDGIGAYYGDFYSVRCVKNP